ncbi:MAG: MutS protein msh5 [Sclerophora amabilis]|nr:MAG: MutS protein msh5 [Sclerophora amabilis]
MELGSERQAGQAGDEDRNRMDAPYLLEIRPSPEYSYGAAINKLLKLQVSHNNDSRTNFVATGDEDDADQFTKAQGREFAGRRGKQLRLSGLIDIESHVTFTFSALKILEALKDITTSETLEVERLVVQEFEACHFGQIGTMITDIIDFQASGEQNRAVVNAGVDDELDMMRHQYDGLESLLTEVARQLREHAPTEARSLLNVVYIPQIGYLIVIPLDPATGRAIYEGEGDPENDWHLMFTDAKAYFKSNEMREMDAHFGDLYLMICDKEIEIVHSLAQRVLAYEDLLITCSDLCGQLDWQGARMYKFSRPQVVTENSIRIKDGRHPLQELVVESYVPNDTTIIGGKGDDSAEESVDTETRMGNSSMTESEEAEGPSMLIMTGPNYSGKSVYLKQVRGSTSFKY